MLQNLQTVIELINNNNHLSEEEKANMIAGIKEADKKITITEFKLDRTEKVKRTTAILLEETIEELEQKRKAVEAQNKELEIEASLERVRTVAMSMNKANDMLDVCKTIAHQLELLAVKEIRNVQTAIFYKEKGTYMNYEYYAKHDKTFITETSYTNSEMHLAFAEQMLKGNGEVFTSHIKGDEVKDWIADQKTTNVFIDDYLYNATSLNYYWFSLGPVALGISTYQPLKEEETNLFKRFLKVFELAYRRYLDIEQATAQAREAQIQLALERVRARTMAMQKSDELGEAAHLLFKMVESFGVSSWICGFSIWEDDMKRCKNWVNDGGIVQQQFDTPNSEGVFLRCYDAVQKGESLYVEEMGGELLVNHYKYLISLPNVGEGLKNFISSGYSLPTFQIMHAAYFSQGYLLFITYEPVPDMWDIFKRFAKVFEQTYTRFLDLQKAETQAKESQIQLALERVRARTMAMFKSDELSEVVFILFQQFKELGEHPDQATIGIINEAEGVIEYWVTMYGNQNNKTYKFSIDEPNVTKRIYKAWKAQKKSIVIDLSRKELQDFMHYRQSMGGAVVNENEHRRVINVAFFSKGIINVQSNEARSAESIQLLERFAGVFDLTYTRFLDLQKAEAQSRENQIQLALERARTQSMVMQHSTELDDTLRVFHEQVLLLNINSAFSFLWLPDEDKDKHIFWAAWAENNSTAFKSKAINYTLDRNEPATAQCLIDWKSNERVVSYHVPPNGVENYFAAWSELIAGVEQLKPEYFSDGLYYVEAFMKYGCFGVMVKNTLPEDEKKILSRFAVEFERAYTRFLDLQKAEAQAREAKIETALEKVRARTMAMQRSEELANVATVLFQQVKALGVPQWLCGFSIWEIGDKEFTWYPGSPDGEILPPCKIPLTEHPVFISFDESRRRGDELFMYEKKGEFQADHYRYMLSLPGVGEMLQNMLDAGLSFPTFQIDHLANFSHGNLAFITYEHFPEMHDIFKRFAKVFEQTYTRFLDLQKAEAQAREAQIETSLERVRSRSMGMQKSEELKEVIQVVYEQFVHLNINVEHTGFIMDYKERDDMLIWLADKHAVPFQVTIPYFDCAHWNSFVEAKATGKNFFANLLSFEEKNKFYQDLFKLISGVPQETLDYYFSCPGLAISTVLLDNVALYIENFSAIPYTDEENNTLMRFGKVFQQTYTRFLDLQKAEAQAQEAKIEAALERVRSRSIAMRKSEEIADIAGKIFSELKQLDLALNRVLIWTFNDIEKYTTWWSLNPEVESTAESYRIDYNENPVFINYLQAWQQRNPIHLYFLAGDTKNTWDDFLFEHTELSRLPAAVRKNMREEGDLFTISVISDYGLMLTGSLEPLSDACIDIIQRFGRVFQQSYTRYLDVQKAEAQTREAQIEAALERVRSRTLAMQKSDELSETSAVLFRQLIALGIEPHRLYISIIKDDEGESEFWITDEDGSKVSAAYTDNLNTNASFKKMYDGWKEGRQSMIIDMKNKELEDNFQHLTSLGVPFKDGLKQKRRIQHLAYFNRGFIGMAAPDDQPEETIHLLERFAAVFNLTFTRFNDLKIAEAHAIQAEEDLIKLQTEKKRAEDALIELRAAQKQLIQSEKMASLGELTAGIAHEIQNPLNFVNNFSEVSNELIDEINEEIEKGNSEEAKAILNDVKQNLEKINHHGKRADAIVKGMLQHSRKNNGVKEPTDINALCDEYLRLSYHGLRAKDKEFNADFKTDFDESIGKINIVPQDIGRVLLNLINNAFYATNEKLIARGLQPIADYKPLVLVTTRKINSPSGVGGIEIIITDNGNGIPQKVLDKIFQPFFTTKPTGQGTGLGLSLSYDVIKAHAGEIKVASKEGEGSMLIITIPA